LFLNQGFTYSFNHYIVIKKPFYAIRYISWVVFIFSFLSSLLLFIVGALKTFNAFRVFFLGYIPKDKTPFHTADNGIINLIKSSDRF
jgi:hypothetical protein